MRLLIGREPLNEAEIALHQQHADLASLRAAFLQTGEFKNLQIAADPSRAYAAPLFLLQPPADPSLLWRFAPPSLTEPVSQLCTAGQLTEPAFAEYCARLNMAASPHRKVWEFCYLVSAMQAKALLRPGIRALGFGVGEEPLPALLAKAGAIVLATDAPADLIRGQGWDTTNQHAAGLQALNHPAILPFDDLRRQVSFQPVDMNAIPTDLADFDVCWSSCALEHLGSLEHGLRFIENSLRTLRPGGYAIHTTEFNLSSNDATLEAPALSLFRKCDIEALASRLVAAGHEVAPLNFHPGDREIDRHIDLPPFALPHLKLLAAGFVTTSIGLIIRKAG
ncbi:class I SAM-dependent methyltransferase [Belnapia sp. T6]|uniref:Class I SAM-dependent methyltransferase n=1 Tax=Belnapia mucosa TaxID=2804532 RepID=A0ABS1V8I0_9PROT|nr:class I SAM-dependent methyltransferase [Belnapia mucosa]MBL6457461.1 class I SAM-dependent methyltransferase [Belnapia mucosa]